MITVGLVLAGVLSFRQSLGVLFGANVGTTVTAQLVALKFTEFAPLLILAGFITGFLPFRWRLLNRAIFYFGLVLFSLNLVSAAVEPLRSNALLVAQLTTFNNPWAAVGVAALFTAVVQSSSITTGIAIILLDQGLIDLHTALPLILGANIGTTITALVAGASFDTSARRTAASHALYNIGGVLVHRARPQRVAGLRAWRLSVDSSKAADQDRRMCATSTATRGRGRTKYDYRLHGRR